MTNGRVTKRVVAVLVVVLLAAVAVQLASSATSRSAKSIPARVKALEAKVKALNSSVSTLKADVATLKTRADCLGAQGVTQWGNPQAGQGYIYTNDGGMTLGITTAFDAPAPGQTPTFYAATVNPSCITGSKRAFRLGHVEAHRAATLQAP